MKKLLAWIKGIDRNTLIRNSFLLPILSVVVMSISHVISWYDLGNPLSWAVYLSVAVEIFALASVSAASLKMKKGSIWLLFILVTLIQIVGNVFFTYKDIDPTGEGFKSWIELIAPWTEDWSVVDHRRLLAYIQGGTLPFMSLIALHFYIKFNENLSKDPESDVEVEDYFDARNQRMEEIVQAREAKHQEEQKEDDTDDWDESHALDMVLNNMVEDLDEDELTEESEMIPDSEVKKILKEEQTKDEKSSSEEIVQKVTQKVEPNKGQVRGHRKPKNPGQNPQIMPGTN